jgi:3-oxoacyl-[acyl-carrier protein] reductase
MSDALLAGHVALVTGASRRVAIGAVICRSLASDGVAVLVHSWSAQDEEQPWGSDPGGAEALVDGLRVGGAHAELVSLDMADRRRLPPAGAGSGAGGAGAGCFAARAGPVAAAYP